MEIKKETGFSGLEKEGNELFNINHSFELEKDGISTFLGIGVSDVVWEIMRTIKKEDEFKKYLEQASEIVSKIGIELNNLTVKFIESNLTTEEILKNVNPEELAEKILKRMFEDGGME